MAISPWIRGVVEHGDARGRTIGLPTANIPPTGRSGTGLGRNGPGGVGPGR
ncbi:riboflavin kinase [Sinomonas sp.]|uniref:riboflavin kinase n=1 Tax=Sinomonas sp. TaxID=1914986 RepID=UPI003FA6BBF2